MAATLNDQLIGNGNSDEFSRFVAREAKEKGTVVAAVPLVYLSL
jgi:hypothetical protein